MVIYYHDSAGSYVTRNHFAMIIVVNKSSCPMSGRFKWFGGNCFGAGLAPRAPPEDSKVVGAVVRTTVTVQRCRRDLSWNDSSGPTLSFAMPSDPFIAPVRVTTFPAVVIRPTEDPKKFVNHSAASGPVVISQGPCPAPHRAGWRPLASLQPRTRPPRLTADRDEQRSGVSARLPGQAQSFLGIRGSAQYLGRTRGRHGVGGQLLAGRHPLRGEERCKYRHSMIMCGPDACLGSAGVRRFRVQ